ncbi:recombination protein NinB [Liberibacter crescens]|nr:recombination protein NinB [Liberibacter crescens]
MRSLPQNNRMWAMLTDIAMMQTKHHGTRLAPEDWKLIFLDALRKEMRIVPNLEGNGFVNLGRSSSNLTKEEMSNMIELMHEWGARNKIIFHDGETL